MGTQSDLFGLTFDHQLDAAGHNLTGKDISPNVCIRTELVFEPVLNGIRVTARNENHRVLWGFIASKGMLAETHCSVAVYDTLQELITAELKKRSLPAQDDQEPIASANAALDNLENTLRDLRKSITTKKVNELTRQRARGIRKLANDANRTIRLESDSL